MPRGARETSLQNARHHVLFGGFVRSLATAGREPGIFNTDRGCQFTSSDWFGAVERLGIRVSTDGRRRWMDNVFIERLWRRSLKCEWLYLSSYPT